MAETNRENTPEARGLTDRTSAIAEARRYGRSSLDLVTEFIPGDMTKTTLALMALIERWQAFHIGAIDAIEASNPLAAMTLIRSYAENAAALLWIWERPADLSKLFIGAEREKFAIGRLVANAQKYAPGFNELYQQLSDAAHPSGVGAYQSIRLDSENDGSFAWSSHPRFRHEEDALWALMWVIEICEIHADRVAPIFRGLRESMSRAARDA
ncbi:hypothetical protein BH09ACT2_BH09ACT2_08320 [soil metagenome]